MGLLKDSTFRKFANSCGYDQSKISPDVALGSFSHRATNKYGKNYSVYSGGLLGSDAKFNTVVTAYLMQTGYMKSITGANPVANYTDAEASAAVVGVSYNNGFYQFSSTSSTNSDIPNSALSYALTAANIAKTLNEGSCNIPTF